MTNIDEINKQVLGELTGTLDYHGAGRVLKVALGDRYTLWIRNEDAEEHLVVGVEGGPESIAFSVRKCQVALLLGEFLLEDGETMTGVTR